MLDTLEDRRGFSGDIAVVAGLTSFPNRPFEERNLFRVIRNDEALRFQRAFAKKQWVSSHRRQSLS